MNPPSFKRSLRGLATVLMVGLLCSTVSGQSDGTAETPAGASPKPVSPQAPPSPEASADSSMPPPLLKAIQDRMAELDRRAERLDQRERQLKIIEQELSGIVQENARLRKAMDQKEGQPSPDKQFALLIKAYEQMPPEEAAARIQKMEESVALKILARVKPKSAAQILGGMPPNKAAKFSEKLAKNAR